MRPPGPYRQALEDAARALAHECDHFTWRELADRAQVGYRVACRTAENMARAGALQVAGSEKRAHSRRWMTLYQLPQHQPQQRTNFATAATASAALADVVNGWMGGRR